MPWLASSVPSRAGRVGEAQASRKDSNVLHEDTPLCEDEPLLPHSATAATALSVKRSRESEAAEAALPAVSLLRVLPKWLRVTRLWFEGAHLRPAFQLSSNLCTCTVTLA